VKTPRQALVVLRSRAQLEALVSPIRLEILERIKESPGISIADLSKAMDRPANSLTYHVRKLAAAGILVRAGSRRTAGREEALYALPGRRIAVGVDPSSPPAMRAASRSAATLLRLAEREVRKALGAARWPSIRRVRTSLKDAEVAELGRRLDAILRWLARCGRRREGRPYAVTIVVVPLVPRRKPS
jgi:predicted transcriptional regulator